MSNAVPYTLEFSEISLSDIAIVGGKNASLGEMWQSFLPLGIKVIDGFATTTAAYHRLLEEEGLEENLR